MTALGIAKRALKRLAEWPRNGRKVAASFVAMRHHAAIALEELEQTQDTVLLTEATARAEARIIELTAAMDAIVDLCQNDLDLFNQAFGIAHDVLRRCPGCFPKQTDGKTGGGT